MSPAMKEQSPMLKIMRKLIVAALVGLLAGGVAQGQMTTGGGGGGGGSTTPPLTVTASNATLTGASGYAICSATCTITLPVPSAGAQFCIVNGDNVSTVITLAALGGGAFYEKTARTSYGTAGTGTMISGGAVNDKVCLIGGRLHALHRRLIQRHMDELMIARLAFAAATVVVLTVPVTAQMLSPIVNDNGVIANFNLPTAPFAGTAPVIGWWDTTTQTRALYLDTNIGSTTVAALEDLSGNGQGLDQPTKLYQPTATGAANQPFFNANTWIPVGAGGMSGSGTPGFVTGDMLNGLNKVTFAFAFKLSSTYSGSANRTIFETTNSSFPPSQVRFNLTINGGASGTSRCIKSVIRPADSVSYTTTTTGCTQLTQDANHYVIETVDTSTNPWTINVIVDGTTYSGFPQTNAVAAAPFSSAPSTYTILGDSYTALLASPTDLSFIGTVRGAVAFNGIVAGSQLTALQTYLAGLP